MVKQASPDWNALYTRYIEPWVLREAQNDPGFLPAINNPDTRYHELNELVKHNAKNNRKNNFKMIEKAGIVKHSDKFMDKTLETVKNIQPGAEFKGAEIVPRGAKRKHRKHYVGKKAEFHKNWVRRQEQEILVLRAKTWSFPRIGKQIGRSGESVRAKWWRLQGKKK